MENIKKIFRDYLFDFSTKAFNEIINNLDVYKLILHFLKRNGIESFNFNKEEFSYRIFVVLKEYRESIFVILNDDDINEGQFISKIANFILKDLNKHLYKKRKEEFKEIKNPDMISSLPYLEQDKLESKDFLKDLEIKKNILLKIINKEKSFRYKESLKAYFGLERPYSLSFSMINKIFNIKKSTFYLKLKQIKEQGIET